MEVYVLEMRSGIWVSNDKRIPKILGIYSSEELAKTAEINYAMRNSDFRIITIKYKLDDLDIKFNGSEWIKN